MKKRPNVIWHMSSWGFLSGWILAQLYAAAWISITQDSDLNIIQMLFAPILWMMTFILGAMPGAVMGFIVSCFLYFMMNVPQSFKKISLKNRRFVMYTIATVITSLLFSPISFVVFWLIRAIEEPTRTSQWIFIVPVIIAAIAATYAAHRYMFRLRLWSERVYARKPKIKMKNSDARLLNKVDDVDISGEMEEIADYQKWDVL